MPVNIAVQVAAIIVVKATKLLAVDFVISPNTTVTIVPK